MFFIFNRACSKYCFSYALSHRNKLTLTLYPNNDFGSIEIEQGYSNHSYFKLFLCAIKAMKAHRKGRVC